MLLKKGVDAENEDLDKISLHEEEQPNMRNKAHTC